MANLDQGTGTGANVGQEPDWKIKEENVRAQAKQTARRAKSLASTATAAKIDEHKSQLSTTIKNVAAGLEKGTDELDRSDLTRITEKAAEQLKKLASEVERRDGETMLSSLADQARKRPVASIAGGVLLGLALSRALKATPQTAASDGEDRTAYTTYNAE
ncbi:hypothetical protein [Parvularcula lutaonensis]|uniref:DUF883 domain-containing protein n=1 Tax=Parvularcula lutaonensis TaxID=491923 RepID=A0ABV7MD07_9PROT|nr:hypothetical protein [Parvularcula lutaonensis]GGY52095.1 hypothetical protein GCM10007148_21430 [Parvularcula lutaonensis]